MTRYVSCRAIDVSHSRILKRIKRTILKRVVWSSSRQHYTEERKKQTFWILSLSLEREREKEFKISSQTRTSKTVNRSFSLAFFRHKFNTFVPNASASDASFAFDICSLLFYGDDMRAQFSLARANKRKCLKFQILSSRRRDEFSTKISLFFLSADRGMCIQDSLWNDEREEKKKARVVLSSFLSSVCFCAWCVFIVLRKERNNNVFLCVVRRVFLLSRVCFFWGHLCKKTKKKSKKLAGEKCISHFWSRMPVVILYQLLVGSDL